MTLLSHSTAEGRSQAEVQGRKLEKGIEAEVMEECCLLAWSSVAWSSCFLILLLQDHLPRGGTTHSRLGPLTSIVSQENALMACSRDSLVEEYSQRSFPQNDSRLYHADIKLASTPSTSWPGHLCAATRNQPFEICTKFY